MPQSLVVGGGWLAALSIEGITAKGGGGVFAALGSPLPHLGGQSRNKQAKQGWQSASMSVNEAVDPILTKCDCHRPHPGGTSPWGGPPLCPSNPDSLVLKPVTSPPCA